MIFQKFYYSSIIIVVSFIFSENPLDNYLIGNNNLTVIGNFQDGIDKARDLDFHPTIDDQLWILNQGEDPYPNNSENITNVCVPENLELVFTIYDSYSDGICCESGEGSYVVSACDNIYALGGDFESSESTTFTIDDNCDNSCAFGEVELIININTDDWAKETSWILAESNSEIVHARRLEPGGSTVIFHDAGLSNQSSEYRKDSYSRHFMHTASALVFDNEGFFANTL